MRPPSVWTAISVWTLSSGFSSTVQPPLGVSPARPTALIATIFMGQASLAEWEGDGTAGALFCGLPPTLSIGGSDHAGEDVDGERQHDDVEEEGHHPLHQPDPSQGLGGVSEAGDL